MSCRIIRSSSSPPMSRRLILQKSLLELSASLTHLPESDKTLRPLERKFCVLFVVGFERRAAPRRTAGIVCGRDPGLPELKKFSKERPQVDLCEHLSEPGSIEFLKLKIQASRSPVRAPLSRPPLSCWILLPIFRI